MKKISVLFILITILIGCRSEYTFKYLSKQNSTFSKIRVKSDKLNYYISLPKNWVLVDRQYDDSSAFEVYTDSSIYDSVFSILTITKFKGKSNSLDSEAKILGRNRIYGLKTIEEGKTNFLKMDSFYELVKSDSGVENEIESVNFLLKANEDSTFFYLSASVPQNAQFKNNMGMLLNCIKQFEISK